MFQTNGHWVCLGSVNGDSLAPVHGESFGERSRFNIFLSVPGGCQAALDYLKTLRDFPNPWVTESQSVINRRDIIPNPALPQFPVGTQVALVRQMMLISDRGIIFLTGLVESLQLRVFREIQPVRVEVERPPQDVYEFQLSQSKLLARQDGGLRAVGRQERDFNFVQFMGGVDPFEGVTNTTQRAKYIEADHSVTLQTCLSCHGGAGIQSFQSYGNTRGSRLFRGGVDFPAGFKEAEFLRVGPWGGSRRYEWGLLQGLWLAQSHSDGTSRQPDSKSGH